MRYLKLLAFYSKSFGDDSDLLWLSRNVDFIYSCILESRKVRSLSVQKLNVFLEASGRPWDGVIDQGIADVQEGFCSGALDVGSLDFELALSNAAKSALIKVATAGQLDAVEVELVAEDVRSTGFIYEHTIKKLRRSEDKRKFSLRVESRFGHTSLNLVDEALGITYRLFNFWPSPWVVLLKLKAANFLEDGRLFIQLRWNDGNERVRWDMRIFEVAADLDMLELERKVGEKCRDFVFYVP